MRAPRQRGFTLIELMIVVVISAIMLAIGIPSFKGFILGQRVKTAAFDVATSLLIARSEAIKRNTNVTMTAEAGGWPDGWKVSGAGSDFFVQSGYTNLTFAVADSGGTALTVVSYGGNGRATVGALEFEISADSGAYVRCVRVGSDGSTRTSSEAC